MVSKTHRCERCGGMLLPDDGELRCISCGRRYKIVKPAAIITSQLNDWERHQILDALTEVMIRTKGNIRRSQLETTKQINQEKADKLEALLVKVRQL